MSDAERPVSTQSERAAAIAELGLSLAEITSDTGQLQREVVRRVGDLVGGGAALWRKDDEGRIRLAALHDPDPEVLRRTGELGAQIDPDDDLGLLPLAWQTPEPLVFTADTLAPLLPQVHPVYRAYFTEFGVAAFALVPLRVRGTTVALLGVARRGGQPLDEDDVRFVEQVGAVVAVALDNDRLLRRVREQLAEQNRAHLAAHRAALHDALTGLPNRRLLVERLHGLASHAETSAGLLLVDLDGFKHINDSYGHSTGDGVLVEVAARLAEAVAGHPAGRRATLVRLGGDEFAVLMPRVTGSQEPAALAAALLDALDEPLSAVESRTAIAASVGIAVEHGAAASALLRHADIAMYRAKRDRLGIAVYEPATDAAAQARLRDTTDLQDAISAGQLVVHYQPLVATRLPGDGPVAGNGNGTAPPFHVEALVRWQHPRRGLLPPGRFVPLAEQTGLLPDLTRAVLRQALADVVTWRDHGLDMQVAVNVTAEMLSGEGLVEDLVDELAAHRLPPSALCLELTESELLAGSAYPTLGELRDAGITVAIDDFGTGYSSFAYLADLPLDRLKLDQSFVRRLTLEPRIARLVSGLVDCVHALGFAVVAEGVERPDESALLSDLQVEWQQGFLFSRPVGAATAEQWFRDNAPEPVG